MKTAITWVLAAIVYLLALSGTDALAGASSRPNPTTAQDKQAAANTLAYRGYVVDIAELHGEPQKAAIIQSARQQIDIVESVRLPRADAEFFRSLPILFKDSLRKSPVHWNGRLGRIELLPKPIDRKPFLLEEFLRAYHARRLPQGLENPEIRSFLQAARKTGAAAVSAAAGTSPHPAKDSEDASHLKNEREFFVATSAAYLLGTIDRPPHTRAAIEQQQPGYFTYLAGLFGPQDPPETPAAAPPPRRPAKSAPRSRE